MHDPRAGVAGGLGGGLPVAQDVREKPAAHGCGLVERDPAGVAVVAGGRLADQSGHAVLGDGAGEHVRGHVAAVADRLPARPLHGRSATPTPLRFTTASTPSNVPASTGRQAGPSPARRARRAPADQAQHLVPAGPQVGDKGGSDQAGRTGDDDAHARIFRLARRRASRRATPLTRARRCRPRATDLICPGDCVWAGRPVCCRMISGVTGLDQLATSVRGPDPPRTRPPQSDSSSRPGTAGVGAVDVPVVVGERQVAIERIAMTSLPSAR